MYCGISCLLPLPWIDIIYLSFFYSYINLTSSTSSALLVAVQYYSWSSDLREYFLFISGKTYLIRISNIGLETSINFRIQGHALKLVEVEGAHTLQNSYDSLDLHVGQSLAVLVTLNQPPKDYFIIASTRFTDQVLTATGVLHYSNSNTPASGPLPAGPTGQIEWSMDQARSLRYSIFFFVLLLIYEYNMDRSISEIRCTSLLLHT